MHKNIYSDTQQPKSSHAALNITFYYELYGRQYCVFSSEAVEAVVCLSEVHNLPDITLHLSSASLIGLRVRAIPPDLRLVQTVNLCELQEFSLSRNITVLRIPVMPPDPVSTI